MAKAILTPSLRMLQLRQHRISRLRRREAVLRVLDMRFCGPNSRARRASPLRRFAKADLFATWTPSRVRHPSIPTGAIQLVALARTAFVTQSPNRPAGIRMKGMI